MAQNHNFTKPARLVKTGGKNVTCDNYTLGAGEHVTFVGWVEERNPTPTG
ncbi:MAG: hypothetical protein RIM23_22950 [Coleofasciculus sp. G3-WIS-01]